MSKPGQDATILPERVERRRIQTLDGLDEFLANARRISAEGGPDTFHGSEKVHHEWHCPTARSLEQEGRTTFTEDSLSDFARFQNRIDFDLDSF
jgi:hypothetical protein